VAARLSHSAALPHPILACDSPQRPHTTVHPTAPSPLSDVPILLAAPQAPLDVDKERGGGLQDEPSSRRGRHHEGANATRWATRDAICRPDPGAAAGERTPGTCRERVIRGALRHERARGVDRARSVWIAHRAQQRLGSVPTALTSSWADVLQEGPQCDAQSDKIWAQVDVGLDDAVSFSPCTGCPRVDGARITGGHVLCQASCAEHAYLPARPITKCIV
jgi:hypothetical protein